MKALIASIRGKAQLWQKHLLITVPLVFAGLAIGTDKLEAVFANTGFYFSESFLFSCFWWLFGPLLYGQWRLLMTRYSLPLLALAVLPAAIHLLLFPGLVWLLSTLMYPHTFAYVQTFRFALPEHGVVLLLAYATPLIFWLYRAKNEAVEKPGLPNQPVFATTFVVSDGGKKTVLNVQDIFYLSAAPPYVAFYTASKKSLYNSTLKAVATALNEAQFVRIHKSVIVNTAAVKSYHSRGNGDYDLRLANGIELRVSRHYATTFKNRMNDFTRLAAS